MDTYGKMVADALAAEVAEARLRQRATQWNVDAARARYGDMRSATDPTPPVEVERAYALFEAAELAAEAIADWQRKWLAIDEQYSATVRTVHLIEGAEMSGVV